MTNDERPLTESELVAVEMALDGQPCEFLDEYIRRLVNQAREPGQVADLEKELTDLKEELEEETEERKKLFDRLEEQIEETAKVSAQLVGLNTALEAANSQNDALTEKLHEARSIFDDIRTALVRQP